MLPPMPKGPAQSSPPHAAAEAAPRRPVDGEVWALLGLALSVLFVYVPLKMLAGGVLFGADAFTLHVRRLEFAREHLFGPSPSLPAWYPRELLGTPFWSNLQNFPLIPTRLPLLLVDPWAAHGVGVNIAAVLSAAFTYLLCRRLGLGRLGAALAGWTFACCGFFSSRVMAGHLPLLEAYPALPLLLWLVERGRAADSPRSLRLCLLALALATASTIVAGHPQLPIYAIGAALLYLPVRLHWRGAVAAAAAIAAGVGCMSFVLLPMARLVGRSTRVLHLAPPVNDVWFPAWRIPALVWPWVREPDDRYLRWDTDCYVGILSLAALLFLTARAVVSRRLPARPWTFLTLTAAAALILALPRPWADSSGGSWTLLRSPARQAYVTVFAMAVATGAAVDLLVRWRGRLGAGGAAGVALAIAAVIAGHVTDLWLHAAPHVEAVDPPQDNGVPQGLAQGVGDGRVAMDTEHIDPINRRLDDVGVFDSILLARPYRAVIALWGRPSDTNTQLINGPDLPPRALQWAGVRLVVSRRGDLALPIVQKAQTLAVYQVPDPLPRVGFIPRSGAQFMDEAALQRELRSGAAPRPDRILLPPAASAGDQPGPGATSAAPPARVTYRRPGPDRIDVTLTAPVDGYVRILETPDDGWTATLDGRPVELLVADGFVSAVQVPAGTHEIRMTYATPGVVTGALLSAIAAAALALLIAAAPRLAPPTAGA
jgi:hypothetical protein